MNIQEFNIFDKQIAIFDEFVDQYQDRLHLLLNTNNIVFEPTGLLICNKLKLVNDSMSAMPRLYMLSYIEGPIEFTVFENMCKHHKEICKIVKEYTYLYNHIMNFETKLLDLNRAEEWVLRLANDIRELIDQNKITGYSHNVVVTSQYQINLRVHYYGTERKNIVQMEYDITDINTREHSVIPYTVDKDIFVQDFLYQVVNMIPTHLKTS